MKKVPVVEPEPVKLVEPVREPRIEQRPEPVVEIPIPVEPELEDEFDFSLGSDEISNPYAYL